MMKRSRVFFAFMSSFWLGVLILCQAMAVSCQAREESGSQEEETAELKEGETADLKESVVNFELHQAELFAERSSHTNAWADFDNDGDLDLFVGFGGKPSRPNALYQNDGGKFTDVAGQVGVADTEQTRSVGWGDYNADGHLDLYVGFSGGSQTGPSFIGNRLYRNDGDGKYFTDVTQSVGLELEAGGVSRQISFVDYDNDGDVDLFVAFRGRPDHLFRNDDGKFTDVTKSMRDDPGSSMGAVWFDFDEDGDLDMYLANMDGYANCFYRNDGGSFVEVAQELGLDTGGREIAKEPGSHDFGSIRPDLIDYDNDGDLDIYMTNLGTVDGLYRNDGNGQFVNVSDQVGLTNDGYRGTATWADFDNDGRIDVYVLGTVYRNEGNAFRDVTPSVVSENVGGYGVQSADFDGDGDMDLAFSSRNHYLFRNLLGEDARRRSLQVLVLDGKGHYTRAGSEVRLYRAGTRNLLGTRIVETGSGYGSHNAIPVHFGLGEEGLVDVEITTMTPTGRKVGRLSNVDPGSQAGSAITVKVDADGQVVE